MFTSMSFVAIDISDPINPQYISKPQLETAAITMYSVTSDILIATTIDGIKTIDASDSENLKVLDTFVDQIGTQGMCFNNGYAYSLQKLNYESRFSVIDLHNPLQPEIVGSTIFIPIHRPSSQLAMSCDGTTVALIRRENLYTEDYWFLSVFDVSNPAKPILASTYTIPYNSDKVVLHNRHAYVLTLATANPADFQGLIVIDLQDPKNPREIQRIGERSEALPVFNSTRAFWSVTNQQTLLFDVAPTGKLQPVGKYIIDGEVFYASDTVLYATGKELQYIDITDPTWPKWRDTLPVPADAHATVHGNTIYLVAPDSSLLSIDTTNPTALHFTGSFSLPIVNFMGDSVYINDAFMHVPTLNEGLWTLHSIPADSPIQQLTRIDINVTRIPALAAKTALGRADEPETNAWLVVTTYNAQGEIIPYEGQLRAFETSEHKLLPISTIDFAAADQGSKRIPFRLPTSGELNFRVVEINSGVGRNFDLQLRPYVSFLPISRSY